MSTDRWSLGRLKSKGRANHEEAAAAERKEVKLRPGLSIDTPVRRVVRPVFGKYITKNSGFVEHLDIIRGQINNYSAKPAAKRPLNILLAAPPGGGKSFLIKQLISDIKPKDRFSFDEIYVASLENVSELYDIFQRVQSYNLEGKMPVVFFDEIDTPIGGHALYPKFLAPMWDGTFFVGREKYFLGKSIFFFAGSTLSLETVSASIIRQHKSKRILPYSRYFDGWKREFDRYSKKQKDKLLDFMDRIDAIVRIPPITRELLGSHLREEYEDLAIMLILKNFPDVKYIGEWALSAICNQLTQPNSMRTTEKMIFSAQLDEDEVFDLRAIPKQFRPHSRATPGALEPSLEIVIEEPISAGGAKSSRPSPA